MPIVKGYPGNPKGKVKVKPTKKVSKKEMCIAKGGSWSNGKCTGISKPSKIEALKIKF